MQSTILLILNLIILESLLSVDNAAVLAIMVKDLPGRQKAKALRYGILGAYAFRGICLFIAAWLVKILWLKIVGGLYLLYLVYSHFTPENDSIEESSTTKDSKIYRTALQFGLNRFWATVILVEIMDLAFSLDNIFAAVALSNVFWIIMTSVGIGILAMRFVAAWFVKMIERFPSLEKSAFIVITLLGLKLIISGIVDYSIPFHAVRDIMETHTFDMCFSGAMMLIFFFPILFRNKRTNTIQYGKS